MKRINTLIVLLFIFSCGSQNNVINQPKKNAHKEMVEEVEVETEVEIEDEDEDEDEDESEISKKLKDKPVETTIKDSLNFNQIISKRQGYNHDLFTELLQEYVSDTGKVDYKGFKNSHKKLLGYISVLQMVFPELEKFSKEEKLTYWINAYNALTIDLILRNYPLNSIKDIDNPWDQRLWKFDKKWYNLNEIEHQILRKMDEPRIHFAIVCASESCPKLQRFAFTALNLDKQLTNVTREFLADTSKNAISKNNIKLSKIFNWFKKDFEQNGSLIDFLNQYSEIQISSNAKKTYLNYDWRLNM